MKTAIICPIGPLDRFGYQNVWRTCLQSLSDFADSVFVIGSWELDSNTIDVIHSYDKVYYYENDVTRLPLNENGIYYVPGISYQNANYGCSIAKELGCDIAIRVDINQYIPEHAFDMLQSSCQFLYDECNYFEYFARCDQIYNKLTNPVTITPYIFNLCHYPKYKFGQDSIVTGNMRYEISNYYGKLIDNGCFEIVDIPLELTLTDLEAKLNFVRCYSDILPKRKPIFEWDYWKSYTLNKLGSKGLSDNELDKYGLEIAEKSQDDFISHEILGELING